jgi:hypothetical protein
MLLPRLLKILIRGSFDGNLNLLVYFITKNIIFIDYMIDRGHFLASFSYYNKMILDLLLVLTFMPTSLSSFNISACTSLHI